MKILLIDLISCSWITKNFMTWSLKATASSSWLLAWQLWEYIKLQIAWNKRRWEPNFYRRHSNCYEKSNRRIEFRKHYFNCNTYGSSFELFLKALLFCEQLYANRVTEWNSWSLLCKIITQKCFPCVLRRSQKSELQHRNLFSLQSPLSRKRLQTEISTKKNRSFPSSLVPRSFGEK